MSAGHRLFGWDFICTDVDPDAIAHAQSTIENNRGVTAHAQVASVPPCYQLQEAVMSKYGLIQRELGHSDGSPTPTVERSRSFSHVDGPVVHALQLFALDRSSNQKTCAGSSSECFGSQEGEEELEVLQAVMCNPPFYDMTEEVSTPCMQRL